MLGKVRTNNEDPTNGLLAKLQVSQNKMARFLNGTTILDKISNSDIFQRNNLLSINQLNCQIKLTEVWKSLNDDLYPLKWDKKIPAAKETMITRSANNQTLLEIRHSKLEDSTFMNDAAKLWNLAPQSIKDCKSVFSAKKEIKKFITSLPL